MLKIKPISITRLISLVLIATLFCGCTHNGEIRQIPSFDTGWRFHAGEIKDAEKPEYSDSSWVSVNVPHDWSIEGHSLSEWNREDLPEFPIVEGEWKFSKGDNMQWKEPGFNDRSWQIVELPSTWDDHSNYTTDNVYGWYRRELVVPPDLKGKDIYINVGKIDDADETYFNGVKVGGMGSFPPDYTSAWDIFRYYKVPGDIINYGGKNTIAVRVFDGIMGGGIYNEGVKAVEGIFESTCPGGSGAGYINAGTGWYRKAFKLPENMKNKRVFIEFDGVYMNSDIWINGVHLGNRPYGYSSFLYELTENLNFGDHKNVLAVRVNVKQPCTRWYSGAGIYRNVRVTITNPVHIAHWGTYVTTPEVSENEATVRIETKIQNQSGTSRKVTLETVLIDESEHEVASSSSFQEVKADSISIFEQFIKLPDPQLWSLEDPTLYLVKSKVLVNGNMTDASETSFGIRTFEFTTDKGFFLNGKHVDIRGVCLHHDLGCLGAAVNKRAIERQLEIMKSMGCNAIRTSHNPPAPEQLDLCDRMGFLVMDEAFDEWIRNKTMFGYGLFFDEWSERDLNAMIRRDRNHPSIVLWSIGNEIPEQNNVNAYAMSKRLVDICHREDPSRPVTSGCNTPEAAVESGFSKPLDVFGVNYSMPFYKTMKGKARLIGSETESAVTTRGEYNLVLESGKLKMINALDNQCSCYNDTTAESTLKAIKNAPWVAGQFLWTGFDYIGEPSPFSWPSVSSYFGIVDLCGFPKDRYYLYQSQWTVKPMIHIFPHWNWQGFEGHEIPVWCYSNCESVELFLNDQSLGEKKFSDTEDLHLVWKVPYFPGTLKAVAENKGKTICTDEVQTAGTPAKIILTTDRTEISADGKDLSYVKVEIVDKDDHVCPNADNPVKFNLTGNGVIAGVDNGNPVSHEYFKASERKAFHGLCLVVVQSKGERGTIRLSAESGRLQAADIVIQVR
jgi:beta-galactosidase